MIFAALFALLVELSYSLLDITNFIPPEDIVVVESSYSPKSKNIAAGGIAEFIIPCSAETILL